LDWLPDTGTMMPTPCVVRQIGALASETGTLVPSYPADKYAVTTQEALTTALAAVYAARAVAIRAIFRQVCFAWLTGNGDVHAKNMSVVATPEGEWRVAPMYDVPSTLPYGDHTLALSVGGMRGGLSGRQLLAFADRAGLPARAAMRVLDEVLAATETLAEDLESGALPFSPQVLRNVVRPLRSRRTSAAARG